MDQGWCAGQRRPEIMQTVRDSLTPRTLAISGNDRNEFRNVLDILMPDAILNTRSQFLMSATRVLIACGFSSFLRSRRQMRRER